MTVEADPLKARGSDVAMLCNTLRRGGSALESVPSQVKTLLQSGDWQHFVTRMGKEVHHTRFAEFVVIPPLEGLGTTIETIKKLLVDDIEAVDLLDRALQGQHGGDRSKSNNVPLAPAGNTKEKALRKLRKDAPELHAEVLAGRLSAHAAMVRAGYRPRTFSVRADDAASTARALRKHLNSEQLAELARLLVDGAG